MHPSARLVLALLAMAVPAATRAQDNAPLVLFPPSLAKPGPPAATVPAVPPKPRLRPPISPTVSAIAPAAIVYVLPAPTT